MPPEIQLPSEVDLAALPRWARTILAVRCARRMLVLLDAEWPQRPEAFDRSVHQALEVAESAAANGKMPAERKLQGATREVWAAAQTARKAKAFRSACIAQSAWAAAKDTTPGNIYFATTEAVQAAHEFNAAAVKAAVAADYDVLMQLAAEHKWVDATPIGSGYIGCLWLTAYPSGWPEAPEHAAPPPDSNDGGGIPLAEAAPAVPAQAASSPPRPGKAVKPASRQASTAQSGTAQSGTAQPGTTRPAATRPAAGKPVTGKPAAARPRPVEGEFASRPVSLAPSDAQRVIPASGTSDIYRLSDAAGGGLSRAPLREPDPPAPILVVESPPEPSIHRARRRRRPSGRAREDTGVAREILGWMLVGAVAGALLGAPISLLSGGALFSTPDAWDPRPLVDALRTLNPRDPLAWRQMLPQLISPIATTLAGAVLAVPLGLFARMFRSR